MKALRTIFGGLNWGRPVRSDVLVLFTEGADFIAEHVLAEISHKVVPIRSRPQPVDFRLSVFLAAEVARRFLSALAEGPRRALAKSLGRLRELYFFALFRDCRPKAALTFIDNSVLVAELAQAFPDTRFISVQNGVRADRICSRMAADLAVMGARAELRGYFAMGEQSLELFRRNGLQMPEARVVGSLKADVHRAHRPSRKPPTYDVCLVSHWKKQFFQPGATPDQTDYHTDRRVAVERSTEMLACYAGERPISINIGLRSADPDERAFYAGYFGDTAYMHSQDHTTLASYCAMDEARLSFGMYSTLMYEGLSLGNPILVVNMTNDRQLDPPRHGIWSLPHDCSYEAFRARLDLLLAMPADQYLKETAAFAQWMVAHDPARPAHSDIRAEVENILSRRNAT